MYKNALIGRQNLFFNNNKRMKSTLLPHSSDYLHAQCKALAKKNIPAKITALNKNTVLTGLDTYYEDELIEDAPPLFLKETKLSNQEISHFLQQGKTLFARIAEFVVKEDIPCVEGTTETGLSVYYVHRKKINLQKLSSIQETIKFEDQSISEEVLSSPKF